VAKSRGRPQQIRKHFTGSKWNVEGQSADERLADATAKTCAKVATFKICCWITPERRFSQILDRKLDTKATRIKGGRSGYDGFLIQAAFIKPLGSIQVLSDFAKRLRAKGKPHRSFSSHLLES